MELHLWRHLRVDYLNHWVGIAGVFISFRHWPFPDLFFDILNILYALVFYEIMFLLMMYQLYNFI